MKAVLASVLGLVVGSYAFVDVVDAQPLNLTAPLIATAPTIDGVVGSSEWSAANSYDLDLMNNLAEVEPTTWHFMNDGTYLYIGVQTQTT